MPVSDEYDINMAIHPDDPAVEAASAPIAGRPLYGGHGKKMLTKVGALRLRRSL